MYATGKDAKSVKFNCVQRGHHHALETFPMLLAASLVGGVRYPVSVAAFGLLWIKARFAWAEGEDGDGLPPKSTRAAQSFAANRLPYLGHSMLHSYFIT